MTTKEKIIFGFGIFSGAASATLLALAFVVARLSCNIYLR